MRKTVPAKTLDQLFVPNTRYAYFEGFREHPFRADAAGYEPVNAWWLADAAFLAYAGRAFIEQTLEDSGLKAHGFASRFFEREGTQGYVLHDERTVIVVFRGTQIDDFWSSVLDLATDAGFILVDDGAGGRVHKGFRQALDRVWDDMREHLLRLQAEGPGRSFWFAGHSLGGALATLAAGRALRETSLDVRGLYTFGSPRVGDGGFHGGHAGGKLKQDTFRVVNEDDIVARVPPEPPCRHVGLFKFIDGGVLHDEDEGPSPRTLPAQVSGVARGVSAGVVALKLFSVALFFAAPLRRFRVPVPKVLADHAPVYYSVHLWNSFNS